MVNVGLSEKSCKSLKDTSKFINLFSNKIKRVPRISTVKLLKQTFFCLNYLTIKKEKIV